MQPASTQVPKEDLIEPVLTADDCIAVLELSKLVEQAYIDCSRSNKNRKVMGMLDNNGRWIKY